MQLELEQLKIMRKSEEDLRLSRFMNVVKDNIERVGVTDDWVLGIV